jgi:bacillaene synthase trans-acting acyltransferase
MGRSLFDANRVFRAHMLRLDDVARPLCGSSVIETLYSPANSIGARFDRTLLTHPAIFMVEYSLARALMSAGVTPDMVLGASLGTFAAAALAGFVEPEDALSIVVQQARLLEEHCEPGGMIAVLADPQLCDEQWLRDECEVAAINFASHFVISAPQQHCARIEHALDARRIVWQRLAVSIAFHSRWVDSARSHFEQLAHSIRIESGALPLVCCERAEVVGDLKPDRFWRVTRAPIRFPQAIATLERNGEYRYVDVGPAGTLATFLKYGLDRASKSTVHAVLTPYGSDLKNWATLTGTEQ